FHLIVKLAIAAKDFHFAISERIPSRANAGSDFVAPAEVDRRADAALRLVFRGQSFLFNTKAGIDGEAACDGPRVLEKERVIVASNVPPGADVVDADVPELALANSIFRYERSTVCGASSALRRIRAAVSNKKIHARNVVVLIDVVG